MSNAFLIEHDALVRVAAAGYRGAAEAVAATWERYGKAARTVMVEPMRAARVPLPVTLAQWLPAGEVNVEPLPPLIEFVYDEGVTPKGQRYRRFKGRVEGCQDWIEVERVIL